MRNNKQINRSFIFLIILMCGLLFFVFDTGINANENQLTISVEDEQLSVFNDRPISTDIFVNSTTNEQMKINISGNWTGAKPENTTIILSNNSGTTPFYANMTVISTNNEIGNFTYELTISTEKNDFTKIIYLKIQSNQTIILDTDKSSYEKGEDIQITGKILKNVIEKEPINSTISLHISKGNFSRFQTLNLDNNTFHFNYTISYGDPEGKWNISVETYDDNGNKILQVTTVNITIPIDIVRYNVIWFSPAKNAVYQRGNTINISVYITEDETGVNNASTHCILPSLDKIELTEIKQGYYQEQYTIPWYGSEGEWSLSLDTVKEESSQFVGGSNTLITIQPAKLNLTFIHPLKQKYFKDDAIPIKISLTYPTDEPVENATIYADISGERISFLNEGNGSYVGNVLLHDKQDENCIINITATDQFGNIARSQNLFYVMGQNKQGIPLMIPFIILTSIISIFLIVYLLKNQNVKIKFNNVEAEIEELNRLQKEAVIAYYQKGTISRKTYDHLRKEHEQRLSELKAHNQRLNNNRI